MKYRLVTILCVCCLAIGMTGCANTAKKSSNNKTVESADIDEGQEETAANGQQVVTDGYLLTLPEGITPQVNEEGLILSNEHMDYQMLVTVRDYAFDSKKETPEFFAEKVKEAGYEITRDVDIVNAAEREFAYFNYQNDGDQMLLAYSKADEDRTFAALVQRYGDLSDEEILTQIANILAAAEKTDLPDTTVDDIVEQNTQDSQGK